MGEVAEMFDVNQSLIRFWEKSFDIIKPQKNKKGNRQFSPKDIENLKMIYHLVKERGMTIDGANKLMKSNPKGIERDAEVADKLQRIKAILLEIKAELNEIDDPEERKNIAIEVKITEQEVVGEAEVKEQDIVDVVEEMTEHQEVDAAEVAIAEEFETKIETEVEMEVSAPEVVEVYEEEPKKPMVEQQSLF